MFAPIVPFPGPLAVLLAVPMAGLFVLSFAGSNWADRHASKYRAAVVHLLLVQFLTSAVMTAALATGLIRSGTVAFWSGNGYLADGLFSISMRVDGTSLLMITLVSFVGWVTGRYAFRYLNGEPHQGRYFRFVAWTIGAVCVMSMSGNLLMLSIAWVATRTEKTPEVLFDVQGFIAAALPISRQVAMTSVAAQGW